MRLMKNRILMQDDDNSIGTPVEDNPFGVVEPNAEALAAEVDELMEDEPAEIIVEDDPVIVDPPQTEKVVVVEEPDPADPAPVVEPVVEPVTPDPVEPVVVESEVTPALVAEPADEVSELKKQIEVLTLAMTNMASGMLPGTLPAPTDQSVLPGQGAVPVQVPILPTTPAPVVPVQGAPVPAQPNAVADILANANMAEILESEEGFKGFLTNAFEAVRQSAVRDASDSFTQQNQAAELVSKFYTDNAILTPVKAYVAQVAGQLQAQYPTSTLESVLATTAVIVKKNLNIVDAVLPPAPADILPPGSEVVTPSVNPNPVLPGAGGGARPVAQVVSDLQSEIDDFLTEDE